MFGGPEISENRLQKTLKMVANPWVRCFNQIDAYLGECKGRYRTVCQPVSAMAHDIII